MMRMVRYFCLFDTSSSFENIDLEFRLRQRDINNLIIAGMETSACVESIARTARET
jgi:nicotinamidase-related amidase